MNSLGMHRKVEPELLDHLPACDPRAVRSRRDLRRINAWMGNVRAVAGALSGAGHPLIHVVELGAGDGNFMLRVVQRLPRLEGPARVTLVDQQSIVGEETLRAFAAVGWQAESVVADVFEWLCTSSAKTADTIVANLFLHHLSEPELAALARLAARNAKVFVANEPRRSAFALLASKLLWLIGCHAVTRHDAVVSVRAGFRGNELSALWPNPERWQFTESRAGLFGHRFVARRI